jgi:hypothetical protein
VGDPVQVVNITDDANAQVAVVAYRTGEMTISWSDGIWAASAERIRQVREVTSDAIRQRDARDISLFISRIRSLLLNMLSVADSRTLTDTVLSPSGCKISFKFDASTLERGTETYEVIVRRVHAHD